MNCILAVRYEIKIKFGSQEFAAAQVQGFCQATNEESEGFFPIYGKKIFQNK
jgi:hypothetical protein